MKTDKRGCRIILSATPADGIFAAHFGRAEIRRFRLKGSLRQDTSLLAAKEEQKREFARYNLRL
jgi:hypothetical protein